MITYVEEKQKPEKILRETKFLPKLVLRIETFNKYVIYLGKKTKYNLASHLHIGRVRYFKIKGLQDVLDRTMQDCGHSDVDESNLDEQEIDDEPMSDSDLNSIVELSDTSSPSSSTTRSSGLLKELGDGLTKAKVLRNMDRINKKAKRVQKPDTKGAPPTKRRKTKPKDA